MATPTRILIAEDETYVREPLRMFLEHSGYVVTLADDGEDAWEQLSISQPDLVISDLKMPRMDGYQLLTRIVAEMPKLPVIVMSGAGTFEAVLRALRSGAWNYLEKPIVDYDLLLHSIESVLEKRELIRMAEKYQQLFEQSRRERSEEREEELRVRKIIEEQLLTARQEWEETVNFLPDPIALYSRDHRIIRLNKAMADALGVQADKAVGERLCLVGECRGEHDEICPHALLMKSEEPMTKEVYNEEKAIHYEIKVLPFYELWESGVAGSVLHARDISERVAAQKKESELQARLLHSSKLQSVGQLASGIAHEINTPTQYISSNIDFLEDAFSDITQLIDRLEQDPAMAGSEIAKKFSNILAEVDWEFLQSEVPQAIDQSRQGIEKVGQIVRAMKEFSHSSGREKQIVCLNRLINTTVTVARNEWKYMAEMNLELAPDLPSVPCLADEMGQVILNMIINSAQAIAAKYSTSEKQEKGLITITTCYDNENVYLTIADTGRGIPQKYLERIFEPFFTTMDVGKGSGQGLAIAYDVIHEKHNGSIRCTSTSGEGTVFTISLPRIQS
jgi:PAS domain S-box-containing protein